MPLTWRASQAGPGLTFRGTSPCLANLVWTRFVVGPIARPDPCLANLVRTRFVVSTFAHSDWPASGSPDYARYAFFGFWKMCTAMLCTDSAASMIASGSVG